MNMYEIGNDRFKSQEYPRIIEIIAQNFSRLLLSLVL
jgi:hypothetical protein